MTSDSSSSLAKFLHWVRTPGSIHFLFDLVGLTVLLSAISWYFHRSDPAWLDVNPSPWLLLPMLIGFRYGFKRGVIAAAIGVFCSALLVCVPIFENIPGLLAENAVHYAAFLAVGGISGFAKFLISDRTADLESELALVADELKRKDSALCLFRETEIDLKQSLLKHNAEFISLADQVNDLLESSDEQQANQKLMNLMQTNFGVLSGAMFIESNGGQYVRSAAVPEAMVSLPDSIGSDNEMISLALEKRQLVSCRNVWENHTMDTASPFLAVVPLAAGQGFFVIKRMKLESITWENLARIEAVLNFWVGGMISQKQVEPENFKRAVKSALNLRDVLGVPGYVVQFNMPKNLLGVVRKLAMPGYHSYSNNHLEVIVMDDKNAAKAFGDKVTAKLENPNVKCNVISLETVLGLS